MSFQKKITMEVQQFMQSAPDELWTEKFTGVMQPYFFPYIGYFQLINKCQNFILYDDIQFTKRGWITRNKLLDNSSWTLSVNCTKSSVETLIKNKKIHESFDPEKILRRISNEYANSSYLSESMSFLEKALIPNTNSLFDYLYETLTATLTFLEINDTNIHISSKIASTEKLRREEKIYSLLDNLGEIRYLNPISGSDLYDKTSFLKKGKELNFFIPDLHLDGKLHNQSIIHLILTLGKKEIQKLIQKGSIFQP